jgi:NIMA-interacting peptidyl-prolyl cis-trans isomerase 1
MRGDSFAIAVVRRRASDARAMAREGKARASHVLVKHADSRRPASWRDPEGAHIAKKARGARIANE